MFIRWMSANCRRFTSILLIMALINQPLIEHADDECGCEKKLQADLELCEIALNAEYDISEDRLAYDNKYVI